MILVLHAPLAFQSKQVQLDASRALLCMMMQPARCNWEDTSTWEYLDVQHMLKEFCFR